MVSSLIICQKKIYAGAVFRGNKLRNGVIMKNRFYQVMQQITWVGAFLILAFAVKTFYQAIPDEIYIEAGEKVSYEFDVPVSVVLKEEEATVFENLAQTGAAEKAPGYTVTCKLFWYLSY